MPKYLSSEIGGSFLIKMFNVLGSGAEQEFHVSYKHKPVTELDLTRQSGKYIGVIQKFSVIISVCHLQRSSKMQTHGSCFLLLQELRKRLKSGSLSKAV